MSATPRTDKHTGLRHDTHALIDVSRRMERDLTECLATLRDVEGYLDRGQCGCELRPYSTDYCSRCLMLADVKATIGNCEA